MVSDPPVITYADEACMMATWRSVVFPVMGHRPSTVVATMTQARSIESHGRAVGRGKLIEVSIVDREGGIPDAEVRAALDSMAPVVAPYYAAVACLFEGEGFRAAMIRGVISSFQLLSRAKYPQKVFSNPDECAAWLAPKAPEAGMRLRGTDELAEAIAFVRGEAIRRGILTA